MFIILVRECDQTPSITDFKLAWETATLLACVTNKYLDSTLQHIENQHPYIQHNTAIFVPASGAEIDMPGHLLS